METKLQNLLREIATLSDEDVKTLFLEVHKFPAINSSLLAKMQDLFANTFEDAMTTVSDPFNHRGGAPGCQLNHYFQRI